MGTSAGNSGRIPAGEAEILAVRAESNRGIAAGDIGVVSASLAEDFVVVIGDGTLLRREEYIAAFACGFEQASPLSYERIADTVDLSRSMPIAAEHGHWVGRMADGPVLCNGTYMAMWRRTDAGWMIRSELFVTLA